MCKKCVKNVFDLRNSCVSQLINSVDKFIVRFSEWKNNLLSTTLCKTCSQTFDCGSDLLNCMFSTFSTTFTATTILFNNKKGNI